MQFCFNMSQKKLPDEKISLITFICSDIVGEFCFEIKTNACSTRYLGMLKKDCFENLDI